MAARIGIAGAGLLGRLLAWQLSRAGHAVEVFDAAPGPQARFDGHGAAAFSAAGMLSPLAELDKAAPALARLGARSIDLWRTICASLPVGHGFSQRGSLLLAHRQDRAAAQRMLQRLAAAADTDLSAPIALDAQALAKLEPAVHGVAHAWLLPGEAQLDAPQVMALLHAGAGGVRWHFECGVREVQPGALHLADGSSRRFDWVLDVRGTGARPELAVRGVRGETIWLHAPELALTRPLRLLHPRHAVYIVPRSAQQVLVGASEIESEDRSPVSLRTAVELLSAAGSVLPALAEARIVRLDRNLRPALPDNAPYFEAGSGLLRINGLFRYGWLLAPALVEQALHRIGLDA